MNPIRKSVSLAALALVSMLSCGGCKTNPPQADTTTTQTAQVPQQASSSQPNAAAPSSKPTAQPGGPAPHSSGAAPHSSGAAPQSSPSAQNAPPPPTAIDLPAGTSLRVRLDQDLGSKISQTGDSFTATVSDDVVVDGQTVIARGARADGAVIDAKPLGKIKGGAVLSIRLERVQTSFGSYPVATSTIDRVENGKGKRTAVFGGGGAAFGAIVGALAGGGKGAAIGALAGGGAGMAGGAFTGNKQILLPAETLLTFRLDNPVHITEQK